MQRTFCTYLHSCLTLIYSHFSNGMQLPKETEVKKFQVIQIMQKRKYEDVLLSACSSVIEWLCDSLRLMVLQRFWQTAYFITRSSNSIITSTSVQLAARKSLKNFIFGHGKQSVFHCFISLYDNFHLSLKCIQRLLQSFIGMPVLRTNNPPQTGSTENRYSQ